MIWRILGSVSLAFERSHLVFSVPLTSGIHFLFCNIDINLICLMEMCQKLL